VERVKEGIAGAKGEDGDSWVDKFAVGCIREVGYCKSAKKSG
jgi:hypothetical protein